MLDIFQYSFALRGFEAGIIVAIIAPLIGTFLVLRRYALIADTLAHVSLAGIALALLVGWSPMVTALWVTVISSLGIERLRMTRHVYGESALALFLSGSLAFATVLLSLGHGLSTNLFNYLFGSIVTVTQADVYLIAFLAVVIVVVVGLLFKELVYTTFDEESARVSGIRTQAVGSVLIVLSAVAISLSIPVVGVLLIAALIVVPVVTALQLRKSFIQTIFYAEAISVLSVIAGIMLSFQFNLSSGGTIVLTMLGVFLIVLFSKKR